MPCLNISDTEYNDLISQGWVLRAGPFTNEEDCLSNCNSSSSSSSSESSSSVADEWYCMLRPASSSSTSGSCIECANCGAMPSQWMVTSSGWDDDGDSCMVESFNGAVTLNFAGLDVQGNCTWEVVIGSGPGTTTAIRLSYHVGLGQWRLVFSYASLCDDSRVYTLNPGFDCCGSNTMLDVTGHAPPTGVTVPVSVLLEPVGDCSQC